MRFAWRHAVSLVAATVSLGAGLSFEPALVRDWSGGDEAGRVTVGTVRAPLWGAAWAQGLGTITLENVTVTIGTDSYRAARIEFSGVAASRGELEALFDRASAEPLAARLGRITAERISIPELVSDQRVGDVRQRTTYKGIVAANVAQGRARELTAEGASTESATPNGTSTLTQGRLVLRDLDAAALARLYVEKAGPQPAAMTKLYGSFEVEDIRLAGSDGASARIAHLRGRDVAARATEDSWAGALSLISAMAEIDTPSDEDTARLTAAMADLMGAFEMGSVEATGIAIAEPQGQGTGQIARVAYTGATADRASEMTVEALEIAEKDTGRARIDAIAFTGFSFRPTLEGLKALRGRSFDQLDGAELRKLVPTIGTIRVSGVDFDLPDQAQDATRTQRIRYGLKDLEITADKPIDGIPSHLRLAVRNLSFPVPPDTTDETLKPLADLGYKAVDVSFVTAADWNEPNRELLIQELSLGGRDMGSLHLSGTLGDVSPEWLDPGALALAGPGATLAPPKVKALDVRIENAGIVERYLEQEARRQGKSADALRREYGAAAAFAVPMMLGSSAQAKALGQALTGFINKPGRLVIKMRARDPQGLGLADLLASSDPATILGKLDLTATVEERL